MGLIVHNGFESLPPPLTVAKYLLKKIIQSYAGAASLYPGAGSVASSSSAAVTSSGASSWTK